MATPTLDQLLVYAAMAGDLERVEQRLALGASPAYVDNDKGSALMQACHRGFLEVARRLLIAGADPNVRFESTELTAVEYAAEKRSKDLVDICCEYGGIRPPSHEEAPPKIVPATLPASFNWLCNLIQPFEIHCVFGCCGWDAFDFSTIGVEAVTAQGVSLQSIREDAVRAIDFLRDLQHPVGLYADVAMGREDIPLLEKLVQSVDEVEARNVK